jgi:hypothetical protein
MARFQGNVHAGSDRAASTLLFLVLLIAVLLAAWYYLDPAGFTTAWNNVTSNVPGASGR